MNKEDMEKEVIKLHKLLDKLKKEEIDLADKTANLNTFINSKEFESISKQQQIWLVEQKAFMSGYLIVLRNRIKDLEDTEYDFLEAIKEIS